MKRSDRRIYTMALLGVVALIVFAWVGRDRFPGIGPGVPAPSFELRNIEGGETSLEGLRGKVVLLNIWATWCTPCLTEMPSMQRLYESVGHDDFRIVAVSVDARRGETDDFGRPGGDLEAFVSDLGLTFTILHDPSGDIQDDYGTTGVPESFIIDRDGVIHRRVVGPAEWDREGYRREIQRLIESESGPR